MQNAHLREGERASLGEFSVMLWKLSLAPSELTLELSLILRTFILNKKKPAVVRVVIIREKLTTHSLSFIYIY